MKPLSAQWVCENKLLIFFGLLALCFFVSTIALATHRGNGSTCEQNLGGITDREDSGENRNAENMNYRLPRHVIPINYKLRLEPTLTTNKTFTGSVTIQLNILQPTHNVTLHCKNLQITMVNLKTNDDLHQIITTEAEKVTDRRDLLIIRTKKELVRGNYTLKIEFSGKLEGLVGFYGSKLKNGKYVKPIKYNLMIKKPAKSMSGHAQCRVP